MPKNKYIIKLIQLWKCVGLGKQFLVLASSNSKLQVEAVRSNWEFGLIFQSTGTNGSFGLNEPYKKHFIF